MKFNQEGPDYMKEEHTNDLDEKMKSIYKMLEECKKANGTDQVSNHFTEKLEQLKESLEEIRPLQSPEKH